MNNITSKYSGGDGEVTLRLTGYECSEPHSPVTDLPCSDRREYTRADTASVPVRGSDRTECYHGQSTYRVDAPLVNSKRIHNISRGRTWILVPKMFSFKHLLLVLFILSILLFLDTRLVSAELSLPYPDRVYVDNLLSEFGNNETITVDQLENALISLKSCSKSDGVLDKGSSFYACDQPNPGELNTTTCIDQLCLNASGLLDLYSIPSEGGVGGEDLQRLSLALVYHAHSCPGTRPVLDEPGHKTRPSSLSTWGYGFIFVSIINICSLGGAIVLPFMKSSFYKQILMFMLGLAVGSLAGSGLLFLIPEAFHLVGDENHSGYIWKATTVMGGIYLFFLIEKFLQLLMEFKKRQKLRRANLPEKSYPDTVASDPDYGICSVQVRTPPAVAENARMKDLNVNIHVEGTGMCSSGDSPSLSRENSTVSEDLPSNGYGTDRHVQKGDGEKSVCEPDMASKPKTQIATVAWMIIFGDGLHNFIDGLSIGAAFTESILAGVSVSMAVICEEVPHELGDFAILLNSGMSMKKALLYNFMSACMCYLGLIGGIVLGQNTLAHDWIFAIAGGMFLYISLVDMLPEMNSAAKEEDRKTNQLCNWHVFILQNSGILAGYGLLLLMAVFGEQINFE